MCDVAIILASASPRRRELLTGIGLSFIVDPADVDETNETELDPVARALALASRKARRVSERRERGLVIGADTIVVIDGVILGKPSDAEEASAMLRRLSGRTHEVITAVAIVDAASGRMEAAHATTRVTFRPLSEGEIARYIATGEPFDKAGGYGIQGRGALLVERIEGCYPNVVGLPLVTLADLFTKFGVDLL